jgi:tetratricopeptide (TPR) repeat protein
MQQQSGELHFSVAATYNKMALILMTQCKFDASMVLHKTSLGVYKKTLGEGHSDDAKAYYNMALVHKAQGNDLNEAMELYERSLEIDEKNLGEKLSSVAHIYQTMALVLQDQGKQDEAMALYDKALAIDRMVSFERSLTKDEDVLTEENNGHTSKRMIPHHLPYHSRIYS